MLSDKKINELITGIYNASDSPQYWGDILQMLCELLPGARAAIVHRDKKTSGVLLCQQIQPHIYTANVDADFASQYQQCYEKDIWTQLNKQLNPGESVVDSSRAFRVCSTYMPRKTIIESDFYNEFARKYNVEDYLVLKLCEYGDYYTTLTFMVDNKISSVKKALPLLNYLSSHIQRAVRWNIRSNQELLTFFKGRL